MTGKLISDYPEILTELEVADLLRVSKYTLQHWRCHGGGPRYIKAGGVRYRRAAVLAWLDSRERLTTSDLPKTVPSIQTVPEPRHRGRC